MSVGPRRHAAAVTARACDALVIGAGIVGIATAFHLKRLRPALDVVLVDAGQPMGFTSAQSGDNYRNWWPHPVMTAFTDRSIDLMEAIARQSGNAPNMDRRGYALATRSDDVDGMLDELVAGYAGTAAIRVHDRGSGATYRPPPLSGDFADAPDGVDVLRDTALIRRIFPSYARDVRTVVHIRRAGSLSGQQLGQHMLERFVAAGGRRRTGTVTAIERRDGFVVHLEAPAARLRAERLINAAGPCIARIAGLLGTRLPVRNVLQQKIAFEDRAGAIPRQMPFTIDLDAQRLDWEEDERALLASDPDHARYAAEMPGAIHCRPDGGERGTWVKLGWAYNTDDSSPSREPPLSDAFPEIVLRGAARLNPSLKAYYGRLPANARHYGGYYTMTDENWPLIGETEIAGAFVVGAMSGFGTMAACAAGELCARRLTGDELPAYADALAPARRADPVLMAELARASSRGIL